MRERMTLQNQESGEITPQSLVNIRPVVAAIREFIGSSPLSQFMDPVSYTHLDVYKRQDITEVIGQYVQLRHRGRTYTGLCPFHNEKTPSFKMCIRDRHYAGQNPFPAYGNAGILQQWMFYFARSEKERVK